MITLLYDKPVSPIMIFSDWEPAVNVKMINIKSISVLLSEFVFSYVIMMHKVLYIISRFHDMLP